MEIDYDNLKWNILEILYDSGLSADAIDSTADDIVCLIKEKIEWADALEMIDYPDIIEGLEPNPEFDGDIDNEQMDKYRLGRG